MTGVRDRRLAAAVGLAAFLVFISNGRLIATGDSLPARYLPFALLRYGTLSLDPVREAAANRDRQPYWLVSSRDGRTVSQYPIVTPLLVTPAYLPALLVLERSGFREDRLERLGALMEKTTAAALAAAASALVFLLVRRRLTRGRALLLAAAFAFGTSTWCISSQALWQHATAEFLLALALLCLTGGASAAALAVAGWATGMMACNRPPDVAISAALALYVVLTFRRRAVWFAAFAAIPTLFVLWYNVATFGSIRGGYAVMLGTTDTFFAHSVLAGVAGLLFSPGKGLFVWSPFLVFLALRLRRGRPDGEDVRLAACLGTAFAALVLIYSRTDFRAGYCYGPRFLLDIMPALVLLLVPVVARLRRGALALFAFCVVFGIAVQVVGAFCYPNGASDVDLDPWHTFPPLVEARAGLAPTFYRRLSAF